MLANRFLYEVEYEWRRWAGQRLKYSVLLFGFAVVCALLALSIRLGEILFMEAPSWVRSDARFYTLLREQPGMGVRPVDRRTLAKLAEIPGVDQARWISFRSMEFQHDQVLLDRLATALFDPGLPGLVEARSFQSSHPARASAWISQRLYQRSFGGDPAVLGTTLRNERLPYPLVIAGILDDAFNRIGVHAPDVWMDGSNLMHLTPFAMPPPGQVNPGQETRIREFLEAAPIYYGIFTSDRNAPADELQVALDSIPDIEAVHRQVSFNDFDVPAKVLPGINLAPEARRALRDQWVALTALLVALAAVLTVNAVTIFAGHWVLRWSELGVMRMLGAGSRDFFKSQLFGLAPSVALLCAGSALILILLTHWMEASPGYSEWAGDRPFAIPVGQWAVALFLATAVLALCRSLPLVRLLKRSLFTRAIGSHRSRRHKLFAQSVLVMQLSGAFAAAMVAGSLSISEWQRQQNTVIDVAMTEIEIVGREAFVIPESLMQADFAGTSGSKVGLASDSVVSSGAPFEIQSPAISRNLFVHGWHVNPSWFEVLGVKVLHELENREGKGAVINFTLARLLSGDRPIDELLGDALRVKTPFETRYPVTAVVEDLPHLGRAESHLPAIYLPMEDSRLLASLNVVVSEEAAASALNALRESGLSDGASGMRVNPAGTIAELLAEADRARLRLLYSTILVAAIILLSVLVSLIYQVRSRLELDRHEYGVHLAVGAPRSQIWWLAMRDALTALVIASPLALFVIWVSIKPLDRERAQDLFQPGMIPFAVLLISLLVVFAALLPVTRALKTPLAKILRED